ncbi:hypothetical protein [Geotoga petraea]|uniref:Uncharacterized protein n=1 Tax=Geotoga petraea TaxID=28234 RepID=A0A1G6K044_9BACT|nr:hypothetical protein [Geotoga petraea]SDC24334.1 hypothetical protein SAMN04488588_0691 [Geotoga petraea]
MSEIFISAKAKNFGDHKKDFYIKNSFEFIENLDLFIYNITKVSDAITSLKFNLNRNEFSDFIIKDQKNFITDEENKEIYLFDSFEKPELLKDLIIKANKEVFNRRAKITELINQLQYDYMIQINPWYKHSKARLYLSDENENKESFGHIDLLNNKHYMKNNQELLNTLIKDKRVRIISKFYKISEGIK